MDEQTDEQFQVDEEWIRQRLGKAAQIPIDIDDVIGRLAGQQAHFSAYLERRWHDLAPGQLARLLATYGSNAICLGRLLRDRVPVGGKMSEEDIEFFNRTMEKAEPHPEETADEPDPDAPPICIDDVIADLEDKQARLGSDLDRLWEDAEARHLNRLLAVYSRNAARLSRLLRYRCDIYGQPPDPKDVAMDLALHYVGQMWGIDLLGEP